MVTPKNEENSNSINEENPVPFEGKVFKSIDLFREMKRNRHRDLTRLHLMEVNPKLSMEQTVDMFFNDPSYAVQTSVWRKHTEKDPSIANNVISRVSERGFDPQNTQWDPLDWSKLAHTYDLGLFCKSYSLKNGHGDCLFPHKLLISGLTNTINNRLCGSLMSYEYNLKKLPPLYFFSPDNEDDYLITHITEDCYTDMAINNKIDLLLNTSFIHSSAANRIVPKWTVKDIAQLCYLASVTGREKQLINLFEYINKIGIILGSELNPYDDYDMYPVKEVLVSKNFLLYDKTLDSKAISNHISPKTWLKLTQIFDKISISSEALSKKAAKVLETRELIFIIIFLCMSFLLLIIITIILLRNKSKKSGKAHLKE